MRTPRLLTIVGPSAALYVLAARSFLGVSSRHESLFVVGGLALAFSPLLLVLAPPPRAARHLAWIGILLGVAIASAGVPSSVLGVVHGWAWLLAAATVLDLALPRTLRWPSRLAMALAVLGGGLAASLAGESLDPGVAVSMVALVAVVLAGFSHMRRQVALDHPVEGGLTAAALALLAAALAWVWLDRIDAVVVAGVELCVASVLWLGHLAWADPEQRMLRRSGVPFVVASLLSFSLGLGWSTSAPRDPVELAAVFVVVGVVWFVSFTLTKRLTSRAAWTTPSELASRAQAATQGLLGAGSLEEIAARALRPFVGEVELGESQPTLYALEPPSRVRLDESGRTQCRAIEAPEALVRGMMDTPETSVDAVALRERIVREPGIRQLAEVMEHEQFGVVVRCAHLDHVEGLLAIPIGTRADALSIVEQNALAELGEALGSVLAAALTQRRAESHIQELSVRRREAEDRVSVLEDQLTQLRGQVNGLDRGLADDQALQVAYSATMRRLQTRAIQLAAVSDPVLVVAGAGAPAVPIARFVHERGPRWQAPLVVRDCAVAEPAFECVETARGGTLVLRDLPALCAETQLALIDLVDTPGAPRIIATTRVSRTELVRRGTLVTPWVVFFQHEVVVPPLRERREDLPSLVLFAIDRACRVLAVDPMGIDEDAMAALLSHDWPGDVAELDFVIESAVSRARESSITTDDLPALAWPGAQDEAVFEGTYADVERRTLARALARARGNKSEAARILGLKRTTFVDKLRRHGLERKGGAVGGSMAG